MLDETYTKKARLGPAVGAIPQILGRKEDCDSNILHPLIETRGIAFPYTPDVTFGASANYSSWHFTHSNYQQYQYTNSQPSEIQVTATFTAQTNEEARYMIAALTFLRASTMMDFGNAAVLRDKAGTPPPVLRFNYLGQHMFKNIPVVVQNFSYILERDVDYVEVTLPGSLNEGESSGSALGIVLGGMIGGAEGAFNVAKKQFTNSLTGPSVDQTLRTWVPTQMTLTILLGIQQNPRNVRDNFDLDAFKRGSLIDKGFN